MSAVTDPLPAIDQPPHDRRYTVGTLRYTKAGLITLFAWLLWGDFCFMLMENVVPSIAPLQLRHLNAPNWVIAFIMSTLPGFLNMTVCPWVSFKSDRYRSRWGRRIPFIFWTLPFLVFFLILMGFSAQIGQFLHATLFAGSAYSHAAIAVACLGILMVGFQFFNMFVASVFWYLFNDVVPPAFMGRFLGLFRVVAGLQGILFRFFIYEYAESHAKVIYTAIACIYAVGFSLMCINIKEGNYPPPDSAPNKRPGLIAQLKTYFVECYSQRYYWNLFLYTTCWSISLTIYVFNVFFNQNIGLNLKQIGTLGGITGIIGLALTYPAGILADRRHPLVVLRYAHGLHLLVLPLGLIWLFYSPGPTTAYYLSLAFGILVAPLTVVIDAMTLPAHMRLLPKDRFGQFASAQSLVRSVGTIVGGFLSGVFLDGMNNLHRDDGFGYRYYHVWMIFWAALAYWFLNRLYRDWKHREAPSFN